MKNISFQLIGHVIHHKQMEKVSNKIKSKGNQKISQDPRSIIPQGKKTLILGDSTVKHVEGW